MLVSEVVVEQSLHDFAALAVSHIVNAQPTLFLHGIALIVQIHFVDDEAAHPVCFEKEREVELIGGQRVEVGGAVFIGRAVHRAAVVEDEIKMLARADVLRAFEHHVLEEVREARSSWALVARADVVGDVYCDDGRALVLNRDDTQAVLQLRLFVIDVNIAFTLRHC